MESKQAQEANKSGVWKGNSRALEQVDVVPAAVASSSSSSSYFVTLAGLSLHLVASPRWRQSRIITLT